MKFTMYALSFLMFITLFHTNIFAQKKVAKKPTPNNIITIYKAPSLDSLSYAIGFLEYANLQKTQLNIKFYDFILAIQQAYDNHLPAMNAETATRIVQQAFARKAQEKAMSAKQQNIEYFKILKNKAGIKEIQPGLYYEVLKEGQGAVPGADTTKVKVHYVGTLLDGTEFDNSIKRGEPAVFPLNGVIRGWTEGLKNMPVGSKWRLYLDSEWGYGERGAGANIGPSSALIFEVELLDIVK